MRLSRISTFFWALLLFALAVLSLHKVSRVIEVGLADCLGGLRRVAWSISAGSADQASERTRVDGRNAVRIFGELYLWLGTKMPWTWYVPIGTAVTFAIGYAASLLTSASERT